MRKVIATPDADLVAMGLRSAHLAADWGPKDWAGTLMSMIDQGHG